ncbi:MAG: hypothetical protein LCH39_03740 [Proteobacteria bacterium]|nr:hypothetical protein [Pseudomonadota bacterium]
MLGISLIPTATLSFGTPAKAQHDFRGIWAGERMLCDGPRNRLHVYGLKRIRHPALYEGDAGYACEVLRIMGRPPVWRLQLNCITFGKGQKPRRFNAIQTLRMRDGHQWMAVTMKAKHGGGIWSDDFLRCRSLTQL